MHWNFSRVHLARPIIPSVYVMVSQVSMAQVCITGAKHREVLTKDLFNLRVLVTSQALFW